MKNWTKIDFKNTIRWYENIRKSNKAKISNIHLEKMKKWTYNKKKGILYHNSGEFFHIEGKRITNSKSPILILGHSVLKSNSGPFIFEELNLHRVEAACLPSNERSIKTLEKNNFCVEGFVRKYLKINGKWEDHLLLSCIKE